MASVLEAVMLLCFGLSWPLNAYKAYKSGTAQGTSWQFLLLITTGYVAGIAAKYVMGDIGWILIVYYLNLGFLVVNWAVYFRGCKLDRRAAERMGQIVNERASKRSARHEAPSRVAAAH